MSISGELPIERFVPSRSLLQQQVAPLAVAPLIQDSQEQISLPNLESYNLVLLYSYLLDVKVYADSLLISLRYCVKMCSGFTKGHSSL